MTREQAVAEAIDFIGKSTMQEEKKQEILVELARCATELAFGKLTEEKLVCAFQCEFKKINPTSASDFNKRRGRQMPSWLVVAKAMGESTWSGLLQRANLSMNRKKQNRTLQLTSTIASEVRLKEMEGGRKKR